MYLFLGLYKFSRKSRESPNFNISRRYNMNVKKCKKGKLQQELRDTLRKKLQQNGYFFLHQIEKLIPKLYHTDCPLLGMLNEFNFLDINCIFEGGLTLITVNCFFVKSFI